MSSLMSPFKLRDLEFKNRIFMSPMCQYMAQDGLANNWHLVHLGSRAVGGAALVMCEATAVSPEGRISFKDLGLWNEAQEKAFLEITEFIKEQGSVAAIQLAHAGRKSQSFDLSKNLYALAPSSIAFSEEYQIPTEMTENQIIEVIHQFKSASERSLRAGFQVIEIHMAHGYLLHEFLSPISNQRTDHYGGSFENRIRFPIQVVQEVRKIWPKHLPIFVRISSTDWIEPAGWTLNDSIRFSIELKKRGVDLIDCSSGGNLAQAQIPVEPGYQVQFAEAIQSQAEIPTAAVGLITEPDQADHIISLNKASAIFIGRELLRNPYWPLQAGQKLNQQITWPQPYLRAKN